MDEVMVRDNQSDTPDPVAPPPGWFRANAGQLLFIAVVVGLVCYYLHPLDVVIAAFGLSFIVFIHELGHFAAAKLCGMQVDTFSIGFGPSLPFCRFEYGETTYKLAAVPLGGYVAIAGMGDGSDDDPTAGAGEGTTHSDTNPRSYKNRPVWQRMIVISAGVVMNILLAAGCFIAAYMNGVQEKPAVAARVQVGEAAWIAGLHSGTEIQRINSRLNPWFDDIRPIVSSTSKGETVEMVTAFRGTERTQAIEPTRAEGALFPLLGILPLEKLTLRELKRDPAPPVEPGSPAEAAGEFRPGDRIVAMSDPDANGTVTPIRPNEQGMPGEYFDYAQRLIRLADQPVTFEVTRKGDSSGTPVAITVAPRFHHDLGLRMQMGPIAALRTGSSAEQAGLRAANRAENALTPGDRIVSVTVTEPDGRKTRFTTDPADADGTLIDPLRLPFELDKWSDRQPPNRAAELVVLRDGEAGHTPARVTLNLTWDDSYRYEPPGVITPGTPVALNGFGLAYHVLGVIARVEPHSPAAEAGLQPGDRVTQVKFKVLGPNGKALPQKWQDLEPHQWAFVWAAVQASAPHGVELKLDRAGTEVTADLLGKPDPTWGQPERGLILSNDTRTQQANSVGEALEMGLYRTGRAITMTYQSLYAMVFGRISVMALAGPITMARAGYIIAGQDIWHLLLYMALISVNLAVVNFLPVPFLDGGHMVFLTYEAIRGKPAPIEIQAVLTYVGLAMIGCLMLFVIGLDVYRFFV